MLPEMDVKLSKSLQISFFYAQYFYNVVIVIVTSYQKDKPMGDVGAIMMGNYPRQSCVVSASVACL